MSPLPQSVVDELGGLGFPLAQDLVHRALSEAFPDLKLTHRVPNDSDKSFPMAMVRGYHNDFQSHEDPRFVSRRMIAIHVFTRTELTEGGLSGDRQGGLLSEAIYRALHRASRDKLNWPDLGVIENIRMTSPPRRVADWATSMGPVQYADLPEGVWRWETLYRIAYRPPIPNI